MNVNETAVVSFALSVTRGHGIYLDWGISPWHIFFFYRKLQVKLISQMHGKCD